MRRNSVLLTPIFPHNMVAKWAFLMPFSEKMAFLMPNNAILALFCTERNFYSIFSS